MHRQLTLRLRESVLFSGADVGFLERYPLVVAVADGRIQHVCTHPGDVPWSINMKKGIATALQNSLPSLSPLSSGLTITEVTARHFWQTSATHLEANE